MAANMRAYLRASRLIAAVLMLVGLGANVSFAQVVALGGSNTAGYGVGSSQAFPAVLQSMLQAKGYNVSVSNAGIKGDTTASMLSRVDSAVPAGTKAVLLQIAYYNDGVHGVSQADHTANAYAIAARIRAKGAKVIVVRMSGLPKTAQYFQADHIHMTAQGHAALAAQLVPQVAAALRR